MSAQFKPKKPKARKQKTGAQKSAIAKRQQAEDSRVDSVAASRKKSYAFQKDPKLFLTGLPPQAQAAVNTAYGKVLAHNDRKAQDDLADTFGSMSVDTPAPKPVSEPAPERSSAVDDLTSQMGKMGVAPEYPKGQRVGGKNPTRAQREHNRGVRRDERAKDGHKPEPVYPGNQLPDQDYNLMINERDRVVEEKREERKRVDLNDNRGGKQRLSKWEQLLAKQPNPDVQDYVAQMPIFTDTDSYNPFAPTAQSIAYVETGADDNTTHTGEQGDYLLSLDQENAAQEALAEVRAFEDSAYNKEQREAMAVPQQQARPDVAIRLDEDDVNELKAQAKDLLARKKGAKSQEERDYYKRALNDLKSKDSDGVKSRKRLERERQEESAPTTFKPQRPGLNKYPGPANIQDGFIKVSMETSVRQLDVDEQKYMGGGSTGATEKYTSGEVDETYQAYATRKGQSLEKFRGGGARLARTTDKERDRSDSEDEGEGKKGRSSASIPSWGQYQVEDVDTDEEELTYLEDTFADMGVSSSLPQDPADFYPSGNPVPLQIKKHRAYAAGYNDATHFFGTPMDYQYDK